MMNKIKCSKFNNKIVTTILLLFTVFTFAQETLEKKGNGKFVPDVNFTLKLLQNNITRKNLEKLLPIFTVRDTVSAGYSYNKKTDKHDLFDGLVSRYSFFYKDLYMVYVDVTSKEDIIYKFEIKFDSAQDLKKLKSQVVKNGFQYNATLTKVFIKLGFNFCLVYSKKPSYDFIYYNEKKITISKT